jgi:hypothetical protein
VVRICTNISREKIALKKREKKIEKMGKNNNSWIGGSVLGTMLDHSLNA